MTAQENPTGPQTDQDQGDEAAPETVPRKERGRAAWRPGDIPPTGWRDILLRVIFRVNRDFVSLMAAGVAFFGLLAFFPALATLLSLAALIFDTELVLRQVDGLAGIAPAQAFDTVRAQVAALAEQTTGQASATAVISVVISLFWASRGVDNLVDGINMAHAEVETRNIVKRTAVSLALTAVLTAMTFAALGLTLAVPLMAEGLGVPSLTDRIVQMGRWPLMAILAVLSLAIVYRYAPARRPPRWSWVTPGAVLATAVWIAGSFVFGFFVKNFGHYNPTYGALAGVVVLLLWMWLTSFIVLLGAQLNAEMEHQTRCDTTRGKSRPMGQRDAYMADTLGRQP